MKQVSFRLEDDLFRDVLIAAAAQGLKVSEAVREALREYCDKHSKKVDNIKKILDGFQKYRPPRCGGIRTANKK